MISPLLFNFLPVVWTPFSNPLFKSTSVSPTNAPILSVAWSPNVIPLELGVFINSTVSVPTRLFATFPSVLSTINVSFSPGLTGIVGTPAKTPTASSTLFTLYVFWGVVAKFETPVSCVTGVVPILIFPPSLTSWISCSNPTAILLSPEILIFPVLYIPLLYLSSAKADLPISPPGNTLWPS